MDRWKSRKAGTPEHDELMAAARHLGASQMAKAAYKFVSGISYVGAPKGMIADSLLREGYASVPEMAAWLRAFPNARGEIGVVRDQDRAHVAGCLQAAERLVAHFEKKLANLSEGRRDYRYEHQLSAARALASRMRRALRSV